VEGWYQCIYGTYPYASVEERQRYEAPLRRAHDRKLQSIFDEQLKLSCP
jgi:hypothetical protein